MAQTSISIRIDEDIKKDAETLFSKLGLTLSSATNVFFRQAVRTQGIPFPVSAVDVIDPAAKARKEFGEAIAVAQQQAAANGTSEMTLDEINKIIAEYRQESSVK